MAPDRSTLVAELLTEIEFTDDDARLCAVISRWPDLSGDEFRRGLELAFERLGQNERVAARVREVEEAAAEKVVEAPQSVGISLEQPAPSFAC